jgi:hypothetical protein
MNCFPPAGGGGGGHRQTEVKRVDFILRQQIILRPRNSRTSARDPEQNGFIARALTPCARKWRRSSAVNTVFPAPVSVPVIKMILPMSGNRAPLTAE